MKLAPKPKAIDRAVDLSPEEIAFVRGLVIHEDAAVLALNKPNTPWMSRWRRRIVKACCAMFPRFFRVKKPM